MKRLGVAGGIGSGKSALSDILENHGIVVIDADHVAREVVEPGAPAWRALVDAFGTAVLLLERLENITERHSAVALPLFRPEHREIFGLTEVWGIEVEPKEAVRRLISYRGFDESDAKARIASQITNEERAAIVDVVIPNNGTLEDFQASVTRLVRERGFVD